MADSLLSTSHTTQIHMTPEGGNTCYAQQRYIDSSPPYNLGDGDVPLFVFVAVDGSGVVLSVYCASVPPWAYNGPTKVTADYISESGKKYKYRTRVIDRESGLIVTDMVELTHEIKNSDMSIIPHPFHGLSSNESVILLDPPDAQILKNLRDAGESINELLHDGDIKINNTELNRKTPLGVAAHGWKWKKTN